MSNATERTIRLVKAQGIRDFAGVIAERRRQGRPLDASADFEAQQIHNLAINAAERLEAEEFLP